MGDLIESNLLNNGVGRQHAAFASSGNARGTHGSLASAPRAPSEERLVHTSGSGAVYELGSGDLNQMLEDFWQSGRSAIERIDPEVEDFRTSALPLARIKKVMKLDEDVRMVAHDAPLVFAKACELFIEELTLRGWDYTDKNKRRTLQRSDVAIATEQSDIVSL
jgi:nuclear transcription factor Y gamma